MAEAAENAQDKPVQPRGVSFWNVISMTFGGFMIFAGLGFLSDGLMVTGIFNIIIGAIFLAVPWRLSRLPATAAATGGFKNDFERWQYDVSQPEKERRSEMIASLARSGWIIDRHEEGLVTARKPKGSFSILLFFILMLFFVLPGICYLVWYAFRRDQIVQYTLLS